MHYVCAIEKCNTDCNNYIYGFVYECINIHYYIICIGYIDRTTYIFDRLTVYIDREEQSNVLLM